MKICGKKIKISYDFKNKLKAKYTYIPKQLKVINPNEILIKNIFGYKAIDDFSSYITLVLIVEIDLIKNN